MAISCTAASLEAAATCFNCLTEKQNLQVQTYLLAQNAAMAGVGNPTDPKALLALAKCFSCLTEKQLLQVKVYLLCALAQVSGV